MSINESDIGNVSVGDNDIQDVEINTSDAVGDVEVNTSDIDTDVDIEIGDETETPTRTPTNERATARIEEGVTLLARALAEYRGYAGEGATLVQVGPAHQEFTAVSIRSTCQRALSKFEQAGEYATEPQMNNVRRLMGVTVFLREAALCEEALVDAFGETEYAAERLYNESTTQVRLTVPRIRSKAEEARGHLRTLTERTDGESMAVFGPVSADLYEEKVEQLESEIEAFGDFGDGFEDLADGIEELQEGVPLYLEEDYPAAARSFLTASADFSIGASSFELFTGARLLAPKAGEIGGVAGTLAQATEDLERSAQAGVDDDRRIRFEAERAAERHIRSNEIVHRMPTPRDILL